MVIFDRERVRDSLCRDPVRWEQECVNANICIEQWEANERGENGSFWLLYLPFLNRIEWYHARIGYDNYAMYELRDAQDRLYYECDIKEVIGHWSNVRTDQWSHDAQQYVAEFLQHAQSPNGWTREHWTQPRQGGEPTAPISPFEFRPESPTNHMDTDTAIQTTIEDVDESYFRFGAVESDHDDHAVQPGYESDTSSNGTRVGDVADTYFGLGEGSDDDDGSSNGFSSDISDIQDNWGEYTIHFPGATRPYRGRTPE